MITAIKERKRQEKQRIQIKTSVLDQNSMSVHLKKNNEKDKKASDKQK